MRFVIITGISGAGKTEAMKAFEDLGYFCVDNLPPVLLPKFAELCAQSEGRINRIALVVDIRGGGFFDSLFSSLRLLEEEGYRYEILYLEAEDDVIIRRFKESRRPHPLAGEGRIADAIQAEKSRLEKLKGKASLIIDTSNITVRQLREKIINRFGQAHEGLKMVITIVSFGFSHGIPLDADLVFDVRFLPNPFYVDSLRELDGNSQEVADYVLKWPVTTKFLSKLYSLIDFLIPQYINEGKLQLVIGIGCTGGRHRSVTIANKLRDFIKAKGYKALVEHRDIS
ncbi:MAG TPA: RNase adapter RapZ [Firmicutes bacterium]|uniref:RNase adapter RapZ n=1 Tax=Capillibacterium thermochitinicola TaxID=2699427 RepID=A0A8J6HZX7_9FIRM|nr:RNase adapter RapZ [Capillibacterium thermochitinicola]HHW11708.1 RNase adapter RapZ [Bacillota bacterium]